MGMINLPIFRCPSKTPLPFDTRESVKPPGVQSSPNSLSDFSQFALSPDLAATSESLLMHSSTEAFICAKQGCGVGSPVSDSWQFRLSDSNSDSGPTPTFSCISYL